MGMNKGVNLISPPKFTNLIAWYDASQITGLVNDDPIATWPDLSGNSYDLIQAATSRQPLYKADTIYNGLPYVYFDGTDDYITTGDWGTTYNQPLTFFILGKIRSSATTQVIIDGIDAAHSIIFAYLPDYDGFSNLNAGAVDATRCANYIKPEIGFPGLVTFTANGGNSFLRDGRSLVINNQKIGSNSLNGLVLGCLYTLINFFSSTDVTEVLVYNKALSSYEIHQIEKYLVRKWGILSFSNFVVDNFTRSDSAVSMGSCDSNQVWTAGSYQDANNPIIGISSNKGYFPTITGTDSHAYIESGKGVACVITAKITFDSIVGSDKGIVFRRQDANNYFFLHLDSATDTLVLSRRLAGVRSDLASTLLPVGLGEYIWIRCYLAADSIRCGASCKGWSTLSKLIEVTDANLMLATKHGLYNHSGSEGAFSYFSVDDWGG